MKRALAGEPVATRNGCLVSNVRLYDKDDIKWKLYAYVPGEGNEAYKEDGTWYPGPREHHLDIFMIEEFSPNNIIENPQLY